MRRLLVLLGLIAATAWPLAAQRPSGWVQLDGFYHHVTNDYGNWKGLGAHAVVPSGRNVWYGDVLAQEAFKDQGVWLSAGNRHSFGRDWFTFASVGAGTGDYYLPDLRLDAMVGKAWLKKRNLVTTAGLMYADSKSVYHDVALSGGLTAWFPGVTVEGGGRINWSSPGSVAAGRGYAAITVGRDRQRFITLRGSGGYEGYQLTGATATEQKFQSGELSLSWREWVSGTLGTFVQFDWYDNPYYTRTGVTLGLFRHW
jgi:YaiO family outer membrane protein